MKTYLFIFFAVLLSSFSFCNKNEDTNIVCDECSGKGSENIYMLVNGEVSFDNNTETIQLLVKFGDIEVSADYNPYNSYNNGYDSYNSTSTSYENIDEEWSEFNTEICGFDFEAGYEYELNINRIKDDGSDNYKYCLNGIISTKQISL